VSDGAVSGFANGARAAREALLSFHSISKRFGRIQALEDVSFHLHGGRVTALLGENGAGKSTLMNILTGLYLPDAGTVEMEGRELALGVPAASVAAGIGMVHQQFRLIERLTGFENVSLALHAGRVFQPRRPDAQVSAALDELGFTLDLSRPVWQLTLAQRQQLEILRTIACGARVLVLDEPTSVLSPLETEGLYSILRRITGTGRAVVLISHKIREVLEVAEDIVVMRRARVAHEGPAAAVDAAALSGLIMGEARPPSAARSSRMQSARTHGDAALALSGVEVDGSHGLRVAGPVDLEVRQGELAILLGVTGNGQSELMEAIGGLRKTAAGRIETRPASRSDARDFAFIPAQHLGTAIAPGLLIQDNAILGLSESRGLLLDPEAVARRTEAVVARFGVRLDPDAPLGTLSGGNLQRIVLGRELSRAPSLIVADYPTRGLDPGTAQLIRDALVEAASAGAAVLVSSEEIEESLAMATRVLVMVGGRIVADLDPAATSFTEIGTLITAIDRRPAELASA
jgi:simple sugar transport system ATP-binding protein